MKIQTKQNIKIVLTNTTGTALCYIFRIDQGFIIVEQSKIKGERSEEKFQAHRVH